MTASDTFKILRALLGPWFKENGFKLAKGYLTYQRRVGEKYINVRFQCNSHGWEKHKGSSFVVLMQFTDDPSVDYVHLKRLTEYLSFEQLELIRARQNRILASIPQPPADYVNAMITAFERSFRNPTAYIELYLKSWEPITRPYKSSDDIWFRYFTEDDVGSWALLLHKHVQNVYSNVAKSAA